LGRFDREGNREGLPPALDTATRDLRATVEEKLREIVEAAEARAHEIEDHALAEALEIEQDSEQKARGRFQTSTERAEQMVEAIDAFEREIGEALRTLRQRGEALAMELGAQMQAPPAAEAPTVAETEIVPQAPADMPPPVPETIVPEDVREGVRRRILDLFLAGEPRGEAERMLGRIEDGGRYVDLLDEVYEGRSETQQGSSRRRGGRRRRRPGSPE
jgi:hypothetical protein